LIRSKWESTRALVKANYADARMIYRIREMDPEDVRALIGLPDTISDYALDASRWLIDKSGRPEDGGKGNKKDYPDQTRSAVRASRRTGGLKTVKIVQCQYWRREPIHLVATENDEEPQQMSPEDFEKFEERAQMINAAAEADPSGQSPRMDYKAEQSIKRVFYQCFVGERILDKKPMEMGMFQFVAMTGERDKKEKYFYGMIKDMVDPQRWSNKFLAQTMHHINVNAKGGLLAETDAFVNVKKAEDDWADPTKIVWVKPGSLVKKKVTERTPIPLPPGLEQLMMFCYFINS
jgi:hypothetical protein